MYSLATVHLCYHPTNQLLNRPRSHLHYWFCLLLLYVTASVSNNVHLVSVGVTDEMSWVYAVSCCTIEYQFSRIFVNHSVTVCCHKQVTTLCIPLPSVIVCWQYWQRYLLHVLLVVVLRTQSWWSFTIYKVRNTTHNSRNVAQYALGLHYISH